MMNKYSPQFKAEAVQMVVQTGRPVAHVAKELGLPDQTLGNWVKAWRRDNPERDGAALSPAESLELQEVRAELARVKMENEFLKKAAAFFAKTQP